MKSIWVLILSIFILPAGVHATDLNSDVCKIRPDLCDSAETAARKPIPVKRVRKAKVAVKAKAPSSSNVSSPSVSCRVAGQPYSLDDVDLPLCSQAPVVQGMDAVPTSRSPASVSAPVGATPHRLDFSSYMNSNASHPAMAHRGSVQKAFQDTPQPVSFNFSTSSSEPAAPAKVPEATSVPAAAQTPAPASEPSH